MQLLRNITSENHRPIKLCHRRLIEVKGPDKSNFLQGLVTADVVTPTRVLQYGMFLNPQGRVLYDVLFYHMGDERVWLECDTGVVDMLIKHMKKYVLRSKVEINLLTKVQVYTQLPHHQSYRGRAEEEIVRVPDPRTSSLGERLLIKTETPQEDVDNNLLNQYHCHRLSCGVAEGMEELPPGQCLPFDINIDYLQGVSFTKGCYLGQELTSRTYHTGVVRKRVLPLSLEERIPHSIPWGHPVSLSGKNVGKIISYRENLVLAILRLPNLTEKQLVQVDVEGSTINAKWYKPSWWPETS